MKENRIVISKRAKGWVDHNNGEFAEVRIIGITGIEKDLWLETIQLHREDTNEAPEEFQRRFPVDMWLDVLVTADITAAQ